MADQLRIFAVHDQSGCAWYRVILPLTEVARRTGWDVRFATATARPRDMDGYNLIIGQRFNKHDGMGSWRRLRTPGRRLVYEIDDDVWHIGPENWGAYQCYKPESVRDAAAHTAEVADLVTVTTEPLAQVLREFNPNVAVVGNHIPDWVLDLPRPPRDRPAIGWLGGASHGLDIGTVAQPLRRFLNRHPGWDMRLLGTDYRDTIKHPRVSYGGWLPVHPAAGEWSQGKYVHPSARAQWQEGGMRPWSASQERCTQAFYRAIDFDIGIAPLAPGGLFQRSKSHIKALEYAARGIPVVASDAEPYRDFVLHGVTGFLVRRDHEWLKYLSELAGDEALRAEMGAKAREVARGWTIETGWTQWAEAYERLFDRS